MKLLIAIVDDASSDSVVDIARDAGATGATVIQEARGADDEDLRRLVGIDLDACQDVVLLVVPEQEAASIVERLDADGLFKNQPGSGILVQLDVEDFVGLREQMKAWALTPGEENKR